MKNSTLILFCLVSFAAKSQNYLNESCIWKIKDYAYVDLVFFNSDYYDYINGDTLIGGIDYYKLYRKGTTISGFSQTDSMFINDINDYLGAIREEDETWEWIEKDSLTPKVLFNFNLEEGDSVKFNNENYNLILSDSIFHDGVYKKVYNLEGTIIDLIEGVGFITGPVSPLIKIESISYIQCFSKNGESLNPDLSEFESKFDDVFFEDIDFCEEVLSQTNGVNTPAIDVLIYPNPFADKISIEADFDIESIRISNSFGKIVYEKEGSVDKINLENLGGGLYFVLIKGANHQTIIKRLVKQ